MALLPVLLDMVDDIYQNLDNPEKVVGDIPLLFVPHGRRQDRECPRRKDHHHGRHGCKKGESSDGQEKAEESGKCGRRERHGFEGGPCGRFGEMRRGPYRGFGCPRFGSRGCPCKKTAADDFKVTFDVKSFKPEEITVKVKGRDVLVDGKHEEREDENGFVSRQFTRRFAVPSDYDIDSVATYLDSDGKMTIIALKPKPVVDESIERIIPIERVASVREEVAEASGSIELMDEDTSDSKK